MALGWSSPLIGQACDRSPWWARDLLACDGRVSSAVADHAARVYDQLAGRPSTHPLAGRTIAAAQRRGYRPPDAWVDIDDPDEDPDATLGPDFIDEVVVLRILTGDFSVPANPAERGEVARRWHAAGRSLLELHRATSWKIERYFRASEAA